MLFKKTGSKPEAPRRDAWHPDFRNVATLPDTKTVRTQFFVNLLVASFTLILLIVTAFREYEVVSLKSDLALVEAEIAQKTQPSEAAVAKYKKFQEQEKLFMEANALVVAPFLYTEFLYQLGERLPPGVRLSRIDYRGPHQGVTINGSIKGPDAETNPVVSAFVQTLATDAWLNKYFDQVKLTNLTRNVEGELMSFEIVFTSKPAKSTPAKSADKK